MLNGNYEFIAQALKNLNKVLSPFIYVTSNYDIVNNLTDIIFSFNVLVGNGIIDRLFYLMNDVNINPLLISRIFKIFKKLI